MAQDNDLFREEALRHRIEPRPRNASLVLPRRWALRWIAILLACFVGAAILGITVRWTRRTSMPCVFKPQVEGWTIVGFTSPPVMRSLQVGMKGLAVLPRATRQQVHVKVVGLAQMAVDKRTALEQVAVDGPIDLAAKVPSLVGVVQTTATDETRNSQGAMTSIEQCHLDIAIEQVSFWRWFTAEESSR